MFSWSHWFYLIFFIFCFFLLIKNQKTIAKKPNKYRYSLLTISIFQQIILYLWYLDQENFPVSEALPFHISRISSLLGILYLLTLNKHIMAYFSTFAYLSFLAPAKIHPGYHALGLSFLINHVITIILPYFAIIAYKWRPTLKALVKSYFYFIFYLLSLPLINQLTNGNYFYLNQRPLSIFQSLSLQSYMVLLALTTLCLFYFFHLFLVYIIQHRKEIP
ncbi:TMEM164-related integral membrane acyltransferase [Facklamia lactis]|uniref:TMEM164-related integral membrane acyltransferase n=1 Tax=Facklamia lactis TaxID=2749967 RepID=UPI0018CE257C|nr:TIGR02206 family membrane protein [Facklamia lactis]MBG9980727.1 TIGR02206 family membrane protein [Facklamia lactis]